MIEAAAAFVWVGGAYLYRRGGAVARLTERQCEIIRMIEDGYDTDQIAEELDSSKMVVRRQIRKITLKLTGGDRAGGLMVELPELAERQGACVREEAA